MNDDVQDGDERERSPYTDWVRLGADAEGLTFEGEHELWYRHFHTADEVTQEFLRDPLPNLLGKVEAFPDERGIPGLSDDFRVDTTILNHQYRLNPRPLVAVATVMADQSTVQLTAWKRNPAANASADNH